MKVKAFLTITLLSSMLFSNAQKSIVGTWKLISGSIVMGDSTYPQNMTTGESMKIVTPTHFAVFSKNKATGEIGHASAGSVAFDNKNYTETITYSTGKGNVYPMIAKFTYTLEGDKWHIKGTLDKMFFDETWERVK